MQVAEVWRNAFSVFIAHAPAILLVANVCMAGPAILCLMASAALGLPGYMHASGPLATWEGINNLHSEQNAALSALIFVQSTLGTVGFVFARGVISRLALNDVGGSSSLSVACREAKSRFPILIFGSLIYGVVIAFGAVGINAMLRDTDFDLRHVGRRDVTAPARVLALRTLDSLSNSPKEMA